MPKLSPAWSPWGGEECAAGRPARGFLENREASWSKAGRVLAAPGTGGSSGRPPGRAVARTQRGGVTWGRVGGATPGRTGRGGSPASEVVSSDSGEEQRPGERGERDGRPEGPPPAPP